MSVHIMWKCFNFFFFYSSFLLLNLIQLNTFVETFHCCNFCLLLIFLIDFLHFVVDFYFVFGKWSSNVVSNQLLIVSCTMIMNLLVILIAMIIITHYSSFTPNSSCSSVSHNAKQGHIQWRFCDPWWSYEIIRITQHALKCQSSKCWSWTVYHLWKTKRSVMIGNGCDPFSCTVTDPPMRFQPPNLHKLQADS